MVAGPDGNGPVGYYRFPSVRDGTVVFTCEGSLWSVPLAGGVARRLTRFPGRQSFACLSPDGAQVAFTAAYQGNEDVWVMPVAGGEPRRLTMHPSPDHAIGWSPDGGSVLFRSPRTSPFREPHGYSVPLEGGEPVRLKYGPLARVSYSPDGKRVALGRYALEFHRWRRYLGGWVQEIWVGDADGEKFERVTTYEGMNAFPMWHGDRIYFLSDRDGVSNIYSMLPDGSNLKQHTHQEQHVVRWPALADGVIVYTAGADLWALDLKSDVEHKIDVTIASDRAGRQVHYTHALHYLTDYDLAPDGRRLLVGSRGQTFLLPVKEGRTIQLGQPGVRQRAPRYSPDGKWIGMFSDEDGEETFVMLPLDRSESPKRFPASREGFHRQPVWAPDGKHVAFADQTLALKVLDVSSGQVKHVDRSPSREISDYGWSPDSRWLVYARAELNQFRALHVYDLKTGKTTRLTEALHDDHSPCFDRDGKYVFFLSQRLLDPVVGQLDFEAIFEPTNHIYAIVLRKGDRSPTVPRQPEEDAAEDAAKKERGKKRERSGPKPVEIDLEGIGGRIEELPVQPAWYEDLRAAPGRLFYLSRPVKGLLARDFFSGESEPGWNLRSFDLKRRREESWMFGVHGYDLTMDGKKLVYRGREHFRVVGTETKPRGEDEERDKDDGEKGIVRMRTLTLKVDPSREWPQMLREVWRRERDFFFDPGLGGIVWEEVWARYSELLDRIATREELTDLIGEMIAELSTSHTYVFGGDVSEPRHVPVGLLGAELEPALEGGVRVVRILKGRDWSEKTRSPFNRPHLDVAPGARILAVDGQPVKYPEQLCGFLAARAGQEVEMTVQGPGKKKSRDIILRTMRPSEESELRYIDWVETNRLFVDAMTGGQVGYVHIPDMGGKGLSEFSRALYPQIRKKGLVVDIRYNGGGFVSQLIVARLARKLWAFMQPRHGFVETYPSRVLHGPFVVLTNHAAGSDGDIFAESVKLMNLAPVLGTRSWGGVVGLSEVYRLIDGGTLTVPAVAWWDSKRGWDLENSGVDPDIVVDNTPADHAKEFDAQLAKAIDTVLERIKKERWEWPTAPPYPNKSLTAFRARRRGPKDRA